MDKKSEADLKEYSMKLYLAVNNSNNKRESFQHNINKGEMEKVYMEYMPLLRELLASENAIYDNLGEEDLINYEKWLEND